VAIATLDSEAEAQTVDRELDVTAEDVWAEWDALIEPVTDDREYRTVAELAEYAGVSCDVMYKRARAWLDAGKVVRKKVRRPGVGRVVWGYKVVGE